MSTDLQPGPELDRLVAKKVMGCHVRYGRKPHLSDLIIPGSINQADFLSIDDAWLAVPKYSTDIAHAWEVVEKLNAMVPTQKEVAKYYMCDGDPFWRLDAPTATFRKWAFGLARPIDHEGESLHPDWMAIADTAPHAICLAALKAVQS
jgi:hypothetical protein